MISSLVFLLVVLLAVPFLVSNHLPKIHRCGYHTTEERGYISTPNFPRPYPVPIICQWVIEAPPNSKIAVYFTQFYLKSGFSASEYAHYMRDIRLGVSKSDFGVISSTNEPTYLVSNQRVLVLDLHVYSLDNIHMRVTEHLLETYGFNITYEVLREQESVRLDGCIYHHCSFTGFCLASADLRRYECQCVAGYFGEECQYDDDCGPTAAPKVCHNGGTCRYYIGSSVRTCECPPGFEGAKCEKLSQSKNVTSEAHLKCEGMHYMSHPDYISIYPNGRKCPPIGKATYVIRAALNMTKKKHSPLERVDIKNMLQNMVLKQLRLIFSQDINVTAFILNANSTEIEFVANEESSDVWESIYQELRHFEDDHLGAEFINIDLQIKPIIFIERMEISEKMPVVEGVPLIMACIVHGGQGTRVRWLKDHAPIMLPKVHGRLWNSNIPKNSYDSFTFLLGFDKTHTLDSGSFTCAAEDDSGTDNLTIPVTVKQLAKPLLTPLSTTVKVKESLTITCVSKEVHPDRNVSYFWKRNNGPLSKPREQVEELFPSGSRVILNNVTESANYTCAIHSVWGIKEETSIVKVISEEEFSSSTCHRETRHGVNWKVTAVGSEDFHLCPSNYSGYIYRKCLRSENQSTVWQEPDFSRCLSKPFLKIKNRFESYAMGYRIHTLKIMLQEMLSTLAEAMSSLHLSEAEPIVDILSEVDSSLYLKQDAEENWEVILNAISLLLNSTAVTRKQSKQKMYALIRDVSLKHAQLNLPDNSSQLFISPNLIVQMWKTRKELGKISLPTEESNSSWVSNLLQLQMRVCNSSNFEGNSSMSIVLMVFRNHVFASTEDILSSDVILPRKSYTLPVIMLEAKSGLYDDGTSVMVSLTYRQIIRSKMKTDHLSCYKVPVLERYQNLQACEEVKKSGKDLECQCFTSGLVSVVLLERKVKTVKEGRILMRYKLLPVFGAVISIPFLLYTFSIISCKAKKSYQLSSDISHAM